MNGSGFLKLIPGCWNAEIRFLKIILKYLFPVRKDFLAQRNKVASDEPKSPQKQVFIYASSGQMDTRFGHFYACIIGKNVVHWTPGAMKGQKKHKTSLHICLLRPNGSKIWPFLLMHYCQKCRPLYSFSHDQTTQHKTSFHIRLIRPNGYKHLIFDL